MNLPRRLRNIAKSQLKAMQDRLDRIDEEVELEARERRAERDARRELDDPTDIRPAMRTPEEIAAGVSRPAAGASANQSVSQPARPTVDTAPPNTPSTPPSATSLTASYRILGLEDGADLSAVDDAYAKLSARCAPDRFPEGSEEQQAAHEIFKRVDAAYNTLRDSLDPTAGRFDKLELS